MKMIKENDENTDRVEQLAPDGDRYWLRKSVVNELAAELDLAIKDWKIDHCPDLSFPEAMMALQVLTANKVVDKVNRSAKLQGFGMEVTTDTKVPEKSEA